MIISQGNVETLDAVVDLWEQMVREARPDWNPSKEAWIELALRLFATGNYIQLLAIEDNKIVGFGDFAFFNEPSTGKMHSVGQHFFILPEYRKGQAGYKMYKAWKEISKGFGATVMELFSFADETARWTKVGFAPARTLLRKEI